MIKNKKGQVIATDLTGRKINMLTVISKSIKSAKNKYYWKCICDCGNETHVLSNHLTTGRLTKSCGCLKHKKGTNKIHGLKYHPLYSVWSNMKGRCYNKNYQNYPNYGGRGITVNEEWKISVLNFYNDMINSYKKGLELGRIDNDGNYSKDNCQWETPIQNSNNKRTSVYISVGGIVYTPSEWSRKIGVKRDTICNRKRKGYTDHECLYGKQK